VWRLYAAATLPCIQKGRHGGHHRERKENLTKTIDRDKQITQTSESVHNTETMSKTRRTIQC